MQNDYEVHMYDGTIIAVSSVYKIYVEGDNLVFEDNLGRIRGVFDTRCVMCYVMK